MVGVFPIRLGGVVKGGEEGDERMEDGGSIEFKQSYL